MTFRLTLFLSLALSAATAQNLPDEINFEPYEKIYLSDKNKTRVIEEELASVSYSLSQSEVDRDQYIEDIRNLKNRVDQLNFEISNQRQQLPRARSDRKTYQQNVDALNRQIGSLEAKLRSQIDRKNVIDRQINPVRNRLSRERGQASSLASSIHSKEGQLRSAKASIGQLNNSISSMASQISSNESKINTAKAKMSTADPATQKKIKIQISTLSSKNQQLKSSIAAKNSQLGSAKQSISRLQTQIQSESARLRNIENTISSLVRDLERLNNLENRLVSSINNIRSNLNNELAKLNSLQAKLNAAINRIQDLEDAIPANQRALAQAQREISNTENNLARVRQTISQLNILHNQTLGQLDRASEVMTLSYNEYRKRFDLYEVKLNEAQGIGRSQTDPAVLLGKDSGASHAKARSTELGMQVGEKLGQVQAKYWSSVRAELQGHRDGHAIGYASQAQKNQAKLDGELAGAKSAVSYAQETLRPQFFEEFYARALRGDVMTYDVPFISEVVLFSNKNTNWGVTKPEPFSVTEPSQAEISESLTLETSLDIQIEKLKLQLADARSEYLALKEVRSTYEAALSTPFGQVECQSVYKALEVFIEACRSAYISRFETRFSEARLDTFKQMYTALYLKSAQSARTSSLDASYDDEFDRFYAVAKADGESDGKQLIYGEVYKQSFDFSYENRLSAATEEAREDAKLSASSWIASHPAVTVESVDISSKVLRSGQDHTGVIKLKNVSPINANSSMLITITNSRNVTIKNKSFTLTGVPGEAIKSFSAIDFRVKPGLASNNEVMIEGKITLPGDKYQTARTETFKAKALTTMNLDTKSQLEFDTNPNIKGFRKYYIHSLKVKVFAEVENIPRGYVVKLVPSQESAPHVSLKNEKEALSALTTSSASEVEFRYVFNKSAKRRKIEFDLEYSYHGKVLRTERISMVPH